jgi:hypothetical protein
VIGDLNYVFLFPITNTIDKCLAKYNNYMVIVDLNYVLLGPITNTREICLTNYDNYMVIGDLNYPLLCPFTNIRDKHVIVVFSQTFVKYFGDWTQ